MPSAKFNVHIRRAAILRIVAFCLAAFSILFGIASTSAADEADVIFHNGRVVTVDDKFSIQQALAVKGNRILAVGANDDVLARKGDGTRIVDLAGKMLLPGLIDSHAHPMSAALHEFDHPVPDMESIDDVLAYIRQRAETLGEGKWIVVRQVFITRLREQRYPTRAELDAAAPKNPVLFSTGPDASVNSLALQESGIDKDFRITGSGAIERDPETGEPTGLLRNCTRLVKVKSSNREASDAERTERLQALFRDYNSVGITAISDRNADADTVRRYALLKERGELSVRIAASRGVGNELPLDEFTKQVQAIAADPLARGDAWLRIVGIKTFLDGGILTGSAYFREPWGVSKIYSITDPRYRGVLMIPPERLLPMVRATVEAGLQFTAHATGDGAVHALLDAYEEVNKSTPIAKTRPCLTHSNFMSKETVAQLARLGVVADIQPAWLYLDAHTLTAQFGNDRLRYFQPLASLFAAGGIAGGGSDHMQKIGSLRSTNPYDPFLGMWVTVTRLAKHRGEPLHPEEALTREQAIRFYTANNAYLLFLEDQLGALEPGKLADFIVVDTDLLTSPIDDWRKAKVLSTWIDGKVIYEAKP